MKHNTILLDLTPLGTIKDANAITFITDKKILKQLLLIGKNVVGGSSPSIIVQYSDEDGDVFPCKSCASIYPTNKYEYVLSFIGASALLIRLNVEIDATNEKYVNITPEYVYKEE